jgi:hypothetical protein
MTEGGLIEVTNPSEIFSRGTRQGDVGFGCGTDSGGNAAFSRRGSGISQPVSLRDGAPESSGL